MRPPRAVRARHRGGLDQASRHMPLSGERMSKSKSSSKPTPVTAKKVARSVSAKSVKVTDLMPEAELAAAVAAAPAVVLPEPILAPVREVTRAEFLDLVRKEAYRRATHRNFRNGSPFQDWVNAEAAVSGELAAEGARLS